jgi:hypothetical protein
MTAEIAVMNRLAVALAADSAITIGGTDQEKIYDTVNKLFALSKYQPVGVMIYGRAEFMDVPWETVVKLYRTRLGKRSFPSLQEHADDFLAFLSTDPVIADEERERAFALATIGSFFASLREEINRHVRAEIEQFGTVAEERVASIVDETLAGGLAQLEGAARLPHVDTDFERRVETLYGSEVEKVAADSFGKLPVRDETRARLCKLAVALLGRDLFPKASAGIVVAGYGDAEIYPRLLQYTVEARFASSLKYRLDQQAAIDQHTSATLVAFAQQEMVHTFMQGIEPNLWQFAHNYVKGLLHEYPEHIAKSLTSLPEEEQKAFVATWRELGSRLLDDFAKKVAAYERKYFIDPVVQAIASLPKDELAVMAETLVSLTSFKRKVSMDTETVGGPIDVAVISKGDGLVWIKRKHYFEAALNPSFFANYFRDSGARDGT